MNPDTCVAIGKIVGVHGIKGYVKIHCQAESFSVFASGCSVIVRDTKGRSRVAEILDAKPQGRMLLLLLKGVLDRNAAEMLPGSDLLVEKSSLPELEPDTYYWADIVGMSVVSVDGHPVGTVASIIETGSNDVYAVQTPDAGEILIPAIASVVLEIDLNRKIMRVNLPEGL
ncbi:MAG: ribosome maturation factor RimM [Desulfatirhabdiaceae bacterium]|nr:ribosome maturation factor RimM [Desulfatirhabdiaceae bacterium]